MPAAVKALGFLAVPINQIGRRSDASELQQKSALILDFSFLRPGRLRVVRLLSGTNLQYRLVSFQLKISRGAYVLNACYSASISIAAFSPRLPASPCCTRNFISRRARKPRSQPLLNVGISFAG